MYGFTGQIGKTLFQKFSALRGIYLCALVLIVAGFATVTINLDSSQYRVDNENYPDYLISYKENIPLLLLDLVELENNTEEWIYAEKLPSSNSKNKDLSLKAGLEFNLFAYINAKEILINKNINKGLQSLILSPNRSPPLNA